MSQPEEPILNEGSDAGDAIESTVTVEAGTLTVNGNEDSESSTAASNNSPPTTPAVQRAASVPHKRSADKTGEELENGAGGCLPSSPPKKPKKEFKDYVAEDDEKRQKAIDKNNKNGIPECCHLEESWSDMIVAQKMNILLVLSVIIAAAIGIVVNCGIDIYGGEIKTSTTSHSFSWKKITKNFVTKTKEFGNEFPNQNKETWIQLIAAIAPTMKEIEPEHPAVITILFPPSMTKEFPMCLLRKVGNTVNKALAPFYNNSAAEVKEISPSILVPSTDITEFRDSIKAYFNSQGKAVITSDVDAIKSEAHLLIFHGLCDSYKPWDKRAALLFPVQVPLKIFEKYDWIHARGGDIANDVLHEAWKTTLSSDSGPALAARIADAVVLLNDGDQCKL